jgi:GNAT superfamily N-acetyltransferase
MRRRPHEEKAQPGPADGATAWQESGMGVVIRPPRPADAEGLARASRDLAEQYGKLEPDRFRPPEHVALVDWLSQVLADPIPDGELWLVAECDGEAVGDAQAQLHEPVTDAALQVGLDAGRRRVYLGYLAVQAEYRSRGIGGRLLSAVEDWARERNAEVLLTDTNLRSNLGAVEFYESHGFEQQAVILRKALA